MYRAPSTTERYCFEDPCDEHDEVTALVADVRGTNASQVSKPPVRPPSPRPHVGATVTPLQGRVVPSRPSERPGMALLECCSWPTRSSCSRPGKPPWVFKHRGGAGGRGGGIFHVAAPRAVWFRRHVRPKTVGRGYPEEASHWSLVVTVRASLHCRVEPPENDLSRACDSRLHRGIESDRCGRLELPPSKLCSPQE